VKEIAPERLGATLAGLHATWIGIQRLPRAGEYDALMQSLGAPARDASIANDDLERMLALLSLCDAYVTVSNANVHLCTGASRPGQTGGGPLHVLVPHPPEWRWGLAGDRSPWFRAATVHRQAVDGDWDAALAGLRSALAATLHRG